VGLGVARIQSIIYDNNVDARSLSTQIKKRRTQAGLTLSQVARRAGTSAATLSRYENGWGRFELYTLRKLATALGCRLVVRLDRVRQHTEGVRPAKLVRQLGRLFWDHALRPSDLERHPGWILERVLESGSLDDVRLLIGFFGREAFLDAVSEAKLQSVRTREFWALMLEREGRTCTRKRSPGKAWDF
jgi:transcriptional regulator with XRE-family HTH domain